MGVYDLSPWPHAIDFQENDAYVTDGLRIGTTLYAVKMRAGGVFLLRSTDGGNSWAEIQIVAAAGSRGWASLATDGTSLWCAYRVNGGSNNAVLKISTDLGDTWGSEITINSESSTDPKIHYFSPTLLVCLWGNGSGEIRHSASTDGGATWGAATTKHTFASGITEDLCVIDGWGEFAGESLLAVENEFAESGHSNIAILHSDDNFATLTLLNTIDDPDEWADNDRPFLVRNTATDALELWNATDWYSRTSSGTSPSYDRNVVVRRTSTDFGTTFSQPEIVYDSLSNVEIVVIYNNDDLPVMFVTKGHWSVSPVTTLLCVVNPAQMLFANSPFVQDRGHAYVATVNGNKCMAVRGLPHSTEPVVGGTGMRGWLRMNVTIADGGFSAVVRSPHGSFRDVRMAIRYNNAGADHYASLWNTAGGIFGYERAANAYTLKDGPDATVALAQNTDFTLAISANGTAIKDFINTVEKNSWTDDTLTTGTIGFGVSATGEVAYFRAITSDAIVPGIGVTGNGQAISDGDDTPSSGDHTDAGTTTVGTPVLRTFRITNTGTAPLSLLPVSNLALPDGWGVHASSDFDGTTAGPVVQPGDHVDLVLSLLATDAGTFAGDVEIEWDSGVFNFAVTGEVTAAEESESGVVYTRRVYSENVYGGNVYSPEVFGPEFED